jgi:hypothetical protein
VTIRLSLDGSTLLAVVVVDDDVVAFFLLLLLLLLFALGVVALWSTRTCFDCFSAAQLLNEWRMGGKTKERVSERCLSKGDNSHSNTDNQTRQGDPDVPRPALFLVVGVQPVAFLDVSFPID